MISKQLQDYLDQELKRQQDSLELIASENYVSNDVIGAYANVFTNKYSEGYPGKRYYGGNEVVDELELYTQDLALQIFGLEQSKRGVNVQPLSGSVANFAVYTGLLEAGDTILAMSLDAGGHLTHGYKLNGSGKYFNFVHYGVDEDGFIDYDNLKNLAIQHKPKLILAGFSSYPRNIERDKYIEVKLLLKTKYDHDCYLMADIAHIAGLVAGEVIESPFIAGFDIITTTTHKTLRGPRGALIYYNKSNNPDIEKGINRGVFPGVQGGPFDHVLVAKAQAFNEILDPKVDWKAYCKQILINSKTLAQELSKLGRNLATNGTDNHLIVLDVTKKRIFGNSGKIPEEKKQISEEKNREANLLTSSVESEASQSSDILPKGRIIITGYTGKTAEKVLEEIGLSVNKQLIPNDPAPALNPSGLRIGTPAITTRGLKEADMVEIAHIINDCLSDNNNLTNMQDKQILKERVLQLCNKFPLWY